MSGHVKNKHRVGAIVLAILVMALPVWAADSAEEAAGAGRLLRKEDTPPAVICGGCISPAFASQGKGSITPYGRIELDGIYSNRNTNPLDPAIHGSATGRQSQGFGTFNPRYGVFVYPGDRKLLRLY